MVNQNLAEAQKYNDLGINYLKKREYLLAVDSFNKAINITPNDGMLYSNCGYVYKSMGKYEEALAYYSKALEINPNSIRNYNNIADIYLFTNKIDLAIKYYYKTLKLEPNNVKAINNLKKIEKEKQHLSLDKTEKNNNSGVVYSNIRNQYSRNSKVGLKIIIPIVLVLVVVIFLKGIYNKGYENGKNISIRTANSDAKKEFTPQIDMLKSEFDSVVRINENKIATIKKNHSNSVNNINKDNRNQIDQMANEFNTNVAQINSEYQATIASMENAQIVNKGKTRNESFNNGQRNMTQRIDEVFDLNVQTNKPQSSDWNTEVNRIR